MTKIHLQSAYSDIISDGGLDPRNEYEKKFKQMPLTQEQIEKIYYSVLLNTENFWWDFARAIEHAHGIGVKDELDSSVT
jgi:hypothetical protein